MKYNIEIDKDGTKRYYVNNKLHREDGPAIEYADKASKYKTEWYFQGELHREDGPARELVDGSKGWYKNGKLHREDGPAIEVINGDKLWFLEGKVYGVDDDFTNESWKDFIKINKDSNKHYYVNNVLHKDDGPAIEFANGNKHWYKNGKLHREDGPAIECADGSKMWYKNGEFHREDGPAIEHPNGNKFWFKDGKMHREDGPAIEFSDEFGNSEKQWWLKGKLYGSNDDFVNESWKKFIKTLIFS